MLDIAFKVRNLLFALGFGLLFGAPAFAGIVDGDSRQTPEEFFADANHPKASAFAGSGSLYCGLAGIDVTAQVAIQNDLLLTAAHFFFKPPDVSHPEAESRLRDNLDGCFFTPFFGQAAGKRFSLRLDTLRILSSKEQGANLRFNYQKSWRTDMALVRLDLSNRPGLTLAAYNVDLNESAKNSGPMALLTSVDGGPKTDHDFSPALQQCGVRDRQDANAEAPATLYTDCDVQNKGPSGSALLAITGGQLEARAILTGHYNSSTGAYARTSNSTLFVEIDDVVRKWISQYLSEIH